MPWKREGIFEAKEDSQRSENNRLTSTVHLLGLSRCEMDERESQEEQGVEPGTQAEKQLLRSPVLYPAELRVHAAGKWIPCS